MHIGHLIKRVFDNKTKQCTVNWLADNLNCNRRNIYKIFERNNIDILLLIKISKVLEHDFFQDISDEELKNIGAKCARNGHI